MPYLHIKLDACNRAKITKQGTVVNKRGAERVCAWESSDGEDHFAPTKENYVNEEAGAGMRFFHKQT